MCLAIFRPKGAQGRITADALNNSRESGNDDAFGVMWVAGGKVHMHKAVDKQDWPAFLTLVTSLQERDVALAVHLRWTTHGDNDTRNAHPFTVVPSKLALIHNGIIQSCLPDQHSPHSDTAILAKRLKQLPLGWWRNALICTALETYIGTTNKVVVLADTGEWHILNERQGHWLNDIWYSNDSYCESDRWWNDKTPDARWLREVFDRDCPPDSESESGHTHSTALSTYDRIPIAAAYHDGTLLCRGCADWDLGAPDAWIFDDEDCQDECDDCGSVLVSRAISF